MSDQIIVSEAMLASLSATRPWVKFLAIVGFIMCGLMVLGALLMLVSGVPGAAPGLFGPVVAVVYLLLAAVCFFPCLYLLRYGNAIGRISGNGQQAMEEALSGQKSYWKFVGILAIVMIVMDVIIVIAAVAFGVMASRAG
jgi:hypothetical protein